jgi:hypothetical protein
MKDTDLRGIILQKFYDERRTDGFIPKSSDFNPELDNADILRISEQLKDHRLLDVKIARYLGGGGLVIGRISAHGVDVVEGEVNPEIKVHFVQNTVNISGSSNVVVGDHNQQNVTHHIEGLIKAIDSSNATPADKAEAKSRLQTFLEHPLVSAIAGGAISLATQA